MADASPAVTRSRAAATASASLIGVDIPPAPGAEDNNAGGGSGGGDDGSYDSSPSANNVAGDQAAAAADAARIAAANVGGGKSKVKRLRFKLFQGKPAPTQVGGGGVDTQTRTFTARIVNVAETIKASKTLHRDKKLASKLGKTLKLRPLVQKGVAVQLISWMKCLIAYLSVLDHHTLVWMLTGTLAGVDDALTTSEGACDLVLYTVVYGALGSTVGRYSSVAVGKGAKLLAKVIANYLDRSPATRAALRSRLDGMKITPDEPISAQIEKFDLLYNEFVGAGIAISSGEMLEIFLGKLPPKDDPVENALFMASFEGFTSWESFAALMASTNRAAEIRGEIADSGPDEPGTRSVEEADGEDGSDDEDSDDETNSGDDADDAAEDADSDFDSDDFAGIAFAAVAGDTEFLAADFEEEDGTLLSDEEEEISYSPEREEEDDPESPTVTELGDLADSEEETVLPPLVHPRKTDLGSAVDDDGNAVVGENPVAETGTAVEVVRRRSPSCASFMLIIVSLLASSAAVIVLHTTGMTMGVTEFAVRPRELNATGATDRLLSTGTDGLVLVGATATALVAARGQCDEIASVTAPELLDAESLGDGDAIKTAVEPAGMAVEHVKTVAAEKARRVMRGMRATILDVEKTLARRANEPAATDADSKPVTETAAAKEAATANADGDVLSLAEEDFNFDVRNDIHDDKREAPFLCLFSDAETGTEPESGWDSDANEWCSYSWACLFPGYEGDAKGDADGDEGPADAATGEADTAGVPPADADENTVGPSGDTVISATAPETVADNEPVVAAGAKTTEVEADNVVPANAADNDHDGLPRAKIARGSFRNCTAFGRVTGQTGTGRQRHRERSRKYSPP